MNPLANSSIRAGCVRVITTPARSPDYTFLSSNYTYNISYFLVVRDGVP